MRRLVRWFLYTVLALVVAIWIALGLFRPEYVQAPLSQWLAARLGQPVSIGRLEFNPFYPNVLLAEQVKIGDLLQAEKLYVEVAPGSWWQRKLTIAHLDLLGARLDLRTQSLPTLPIPLRDLTIADLNVNRLTLLTPQFELGDLSLQASQWPLLRDDQWQPWQEARFSLTLRRLAVNGQEWRNLQADGNWQGGELTLDTLQGEQGEGSLSTALHWQPTNGQLTLNNLKSQGLRLTPTQLALWPGVQRLQVQQASLNHLYLTLADAGVHLNDISLQIPQLSHDAQGWQGQWQGSLGELAYQQTSFSNLQVQGTLASDRWQASLQGDAWDGQFSANGAYLPAAQQLVLDQISLQNNQLELPADWRDRWQSWLPPQLDIRRLEGKGLSLLSYDDSLPLSLKGTNLFITDLRLANHSLQPLSDKTRWEMSWGELAYGSLISHGGEAQGELSNDAWRLRQLQAPLDKGQLSADALWSRQPQGTHQLNLTAKQLDLDLLNRLFQPDYELGGKVDLQLALQSQGTDVETLRQHLQGQVEVRGQDLYLDTLQLDRYLDGLNAQSGHLGWAAVSQGLQGSGTGFNQLHLTLNAAQGQLQAQGAAASITHLLGIHTQLDLTHLTWQGALQQLSAKRCTTLQLALSGPLQAPDWQVSAPNGCVKASWADGVAYPPQGRQAGSSDDSNN